MSVPPSLALCRGAGLGAALIGAAITAPAHAAVAPNGSFSFTTPGPNTVDTGDIAATTTSLTLGVAFPGVGLITSFVDPYLGNPNNLCFEAGAGCTAAHPPGFLSSFSEVGFSNFNLPVGNTS